MSFIGDLAKALMKKKKRNGAVQRKRFKDRVFQRDGYRCKACGGILNLTVHHILPVSTHPHLKKEMSNLLTLCRDCHDDEHGMYGVNDIGQ